MPATLADIVTQVTGSSSKSPTRATTTAKKTLAHREQPSSDPPPGSHRTPPTAPQAQPSTPPEEDCMPKRVAVRGVRYQNDNNTGNTISPQESNNNKHDNNNVTVNNGNTPATVATKHSQSSYSRRLGQEQEQQLQPTAPEETVGTPVQPQQRIPHTALRPVKSLLVQHNTAIL